MADEGEGGATTTPTATPTATTTTTTTQVDVSKIPDEALKERLDRAKKAALKEAGFSSPDEAKAMREKLATLEAAEAERAKAAMTEQERTSQELATEKARAEKAEAELAAAKERNGLLQVATAKGVKNLDYADFLLQKAKGAGASVDIETVISEALGDPLKRAALGIVDEGTPAPKQGATTTPVGNDGTAPKPTPAGGSTTVKSAKDMKPEEWAAYKKGIGIV